MSPGLNCATCVHWRLRESDYDNYLLFPPNPANDDLPERDEAANARVWGHRVRRCRSPGVTFYERPSAIHASVMDGSQHRASLLTGEDFGCLLHVTYTGPEGEQDTRVEPAKYSERWRQRQGA